MAAFLLVLLLFALVIIPVTVILGKDPEWTMVASTVFLALITALYTWQTRQIARASAKAAEASAKTAEEMHEQSLAAIRPVIWFECTQGNLLRLTNIGSGPAIHCHVYTDQPGQVPLSPMPICDTLTPVRPGDYLPDEIRASGSAVDGDCGTLRCVYQDVQGNWFLTSLDVKLQDGQFSGLDHTKWVKLSAEQGALSHKQAHR
ncbi:MAG: hypothetical protein HY688_02445 [Chloroflexi bacterium]|nr:hypothetical protein [Chloroflexota bacterium]